MGNSGDTNSCRDVTNKYVDYMSYIYHMTEHRKSHIAREMKINAWNVAPCSPLPTPRIILTEQQAVEICMLKPAIMQQKMGKRYESQSRLLAERFGVSPKTVRDIWNRKTWVSTTKHLFGSASAEVYYIGILQMPDLLS